MNDVHAQAAKSVGVKVAISTDAHSVSAFGCMRFGVDQARRGWLEAGRCDQYSAAGRTEEAAQALRGGNPDARSGQDGMTECGVTDDPR